jgi:3-hexulose-6-phosphate synthase
MVRLQVALDLVNLERALNVASRVAEVCDHTFLLLEAGTPLIKAAGMEAVRKLSGLFPDIPVVADTKTADVGELEAELAISSGAAYMTVLALASEETVAAAVEAAHRLGGKVVADLMRVANPIERAVELVGLRVDAVCYHIPIDVQRSGKIDQEAVATAVKALKKKVRAEVAVAGGITPSTARSLAEAGADILVVGRAIYAASDPGAAAKEILEATRSR